MANPTPAETDDGEAAARPLDVGRRLNPWRSWRRHARLMAAIGAAIVLLGAPAAWLKGRPLYYTEAAVRVSPTFAKVLQDDDELRLPSYTQYRQFVEQQVRTIQRYETVVAGLERLGPQRRLWQEDGETDRHAAERLMAALTVKPVRDTYLITVGMEGRVPAGMAEVVNAVVDAYLAAQLDDEFFGIGQRVQQLEDERHTLETTIAAQAAELARLAGELAVTSFNENMPSPHDQMLAAQEDLLARARQRRIEAEATLRALDQARQREEAIDVGAAAAQEVAADPSLAAMRTVLTKWRGEVLGQLSGLTESHPGRPALERQLKEIDSELSTPTARATDAARARLTAKRDGGAARERSRAEAEVEGTRRTEAELDTEVARLRERVAWYTATYQQALNLRAAISRDRKQLNRITDRIQFLTLEARSPGFVRVTSPARVPEVPIRGGRRLWLAAVLALAVLGALAVPIAIDRFDPRLVAPADLGKVLGFAPLGWTADAPAGHPLAEDLLRRTALAIDRERRAHGSRTFALTGVGAAAGVSRLALDLGRALGELGLQVVVVDCHRQRPNPRYRGAVPGGGLAAVVRGALPAAAAIVPAAGGLPPRVAFGEADEALQPLEGFRAALAYWAAAADVVLLDAPPLPEDADAELVVQSADAALLVVPSARVMPSLVRQAARTLERLHPPVVGAILVRVSLDDGRVDVPRSAPASAAEAPGLLRLLRS